MEEQQSQQLDELLIPPLNFAVVDRGIYRSGYPNITNLPFLGKRRLKSIICLCPELYPDYILEFLRKNEITLFHLGIDGNKASGTLISLFLRSIIISVIGFVPGAVCGHPRGCDSPGAQEFVGSWQSSCPDPLQQRQGHRTGCLVGCLRKLQRWSLTAIFDEYRRFAGTKVRMLDQQFMELFDVSSFRGLTR
ncbi:hypothetical protein SELMODRAFT_267170 [Selaginella moellendorffii]|uniref:Tyrosine-protein phosphatase domain-containing protein n=1 Tax=Selaginella moellendorffii TaxID=88036 RepID=D8RAZ8_SELML|nr:hypothetical protein SELMODRAFT_267170 [Selaginella moellendorffii]